GEIKNFTGIDSPYEAPENPEVHLHTVGHEPISLAIQIEEFLSSSLAISGGSIGYLRVSPDRQISPGS
ncbi:adenylyl-sulfate kinase, partial [Microvirga tunisiensis]